MLLILIPLKIRKKAKGDDVGEKVTLMILHGFMQQLLFRGIDLIHSTIKPNLERLREEGFESPYTIKLERALRRFVDRFDASYVDRVAAEVGRSKAEIAQELSVIPELKAQFEKIADIVVVLSEMEKYHLPRWIKWLAEDLKVEGCI